MTSYVQISVNVPQITGVFDYHLPSEMEGTVQPGSLVVVPFGGQSVQGVVLREVDQPQVPETKAVLELLDPEPVLTRLQLELAGWLAHETLSPLAFCTGMMLPHGLRKFTRSRYQLISAVPLRSNPPPFSPTQVRLIENLRQKGPLSDSQIDHTFPHVDWKVSMRGLTRLGMVAAQSYLPPPSVRPKTIRTAQLGVAPQVAELRLPELGNAGSEVLKRRQAALRFLIREPWPVELAWVYAQSGANLPDLQKMADMGLILLKEQEALRDPLAKIEYIPDVPPELTRDQQKVWRQVEEGLDKAAAGQETPPHLLHGVTASGKTEIYLRAVDHVLQQGRQAIILVPEISLTPQTVRRFLARFPGQVGLVHSGLSEGENYDTWRRARAGLLRVIVGPRSALFTPLPSPGLVVIDECHDGSYYQDEILPSYDARQAALTYMRFARGMCLLGSATPDVTQAYQAASGNWVGLKLPVRILAHRRAVEEQMNAMGRPLRREPAEHEALDLELPQIQMVDMREELKAGNRTIFSQALAQALDGVLAEGQQAILFLNRRGTATYVFCRECGHTLKCPRCDLPLTSHGGREGSGNSSAPAGLVCHRCGYRRQVPKTCPQCSSREIRQFGAGTERVETELQTLFPHARSLRWDADSTRQKNAHGVILAHFTAHRADVLIGTQMLAKGLDLPMVTLVGVVLADVGLNLPDYRAAERTFQVLTQVAGRAGRSPLGGKVILQTYQPENYAIQAASRHDYAGFYATELAYRRKLGYPPFYQLARVEIRHPQAAQAEKEAQMLAAQLREQIEAEDLRATGLIGPAPCFYARINGLYRWQIVVRGPDPQRLFRRRIPENWRVEIDPPDLL